MKQKKFDMTKIIIILACIIIMVFAAISCIFATEVIGNKNSRTTYEELDQTDRRMLETVNTYINGSENKVAFDRPVAFVKNNGLTRGRAFVFNVGLTEMNLNYGFNGGTYSTEILLDDNMHLPTMYRCCSFAPNLGSYIFPADYNIKEINKKDIFVIGYNEAMLDDGSFLTLLDRAFSEAYGNGNNQMPANTSDSADNVNNAANSDSTETNQSGSASDTSSDSAEN